MSFDTSFIDWQHQLNLQYYRNNHEAPRPWGMGKIYNSMKGITVIAGKKVRTPGQYCALNPQTGRETGRSLCDTQEHVHASVRIRKDLGGLGTGDKGPYNPTSLVGWRLVGNAREGNVRWENEGAPEIFLPEDKLGEIELQLLSHSKREYNAATQGDLRLH